MSIHICPEGVNCSGLETFTPRFNITDMKYGQIKVNYTSKGGKILLGGQSYEIVGKYDSDHSSDLYLLIRNRTFGELVKKKSCDALMNDLTPRSPSPLLYSISIIPNITLFKCTNNITSAKYDFFDPLDYMSYNKCKDYTFYYNYFNGRVPNDLPNACQVVHLPLKYSSVPELDKTNDIFSKLSSLVSILFKLSPSCDHCNNQGRSCDTKNGLVQCSDAIKEKPDRKPTPDPNQAGKQGRKWTLVKILVIAGSVLILMLSLVIIFMIWRHCKNNRFPYVSSRNKSPHLEDISLSCGVCVFSYKELEDATQNFDPSHELGGGGFGSVYYGKLQDGREVAVKKLHEHNYNRVQQFINEVEILTKLRHPNLVVLYGFTSRQSSELLLVYEHIPNGTVADHIHGKLASPYLLTWPIRMNIAIETASALVYLHASEIIHRDVKTNNILLDHNFCVKVADFGLSRLMPNNATHVSTTPQGTPGYVDPQYHQRYQLTDKSLKTRSVLANLALNMIQTSAIDQLIDPVLGSDTNPEIMNMITSVAELVFRCLQYYSEMRPTMNEVLDVLMDIQAWGGVAAYESTTHFPTVNMPPSSKISDAVVLLKDLPPSPVSVTSEWQSIISASTTRSSNVDRFSMKNGSNV
ncbi:hypothetical protein SSX86_015943 [Deinandra increscens subsp. villosa]|uniref:Protein kinase domain-containing protein n=1 Tax=Deinandra increscens subsp. villosa TaxID=3103831 RepID=A0AAP0GWP4_9ASTR